MVRRDEYYYYWISLTPAVLLNCHTQGHFRTHALQQESLCGPHRCGERQRSHGIRYSRRICIGNHVAGILDQM